MIQAIHLVIFVRDGLLRGAALTAIVINVEPNTSSSVNILEEDDDILWDVVLCWSR
jgi:hypothetical protein